MKINVQGIEEIEITDPAGLCNPPVTQVIPSPQQPNPMPQPQGWPTPQIPTPFGPIVTPIPGTGDVAVPSRTSIFTRHVHDPNDPLYREKWGIGNPMIQQQAQQSDPEKWEKNWQSKMKGEQGQANGDGNAAQS